MQKWEYCELARHGRDAEVEFFKTNKSSETKSGKFDQLVAWLGENGWELAVAEGKWYLFKRPKSK